MSTRQTPSKRSKAAGSGILLRYREKDSAYGVSRATVTKHAENLGLSETQVIHVAMANLARQTLPRYEADNGPLSAEQLAAIDKRVPQGRLKPAKRLF
jgi:hypothetical protein